MGAPTKIVHIPRRNLYNNDNSFRVILIDGCRADWERGGVVATFDPEVLMQPWMMEPQTRQLNPDPKATLIEDLPCEELDKEH